MAEQNITLGSIKTPPIERKGADTITWCKDLAMDSRGSIVGGVEESEDGESWEWWHTMGHTSGEAKSRESAQKWVETYQRKFGAPHPITTIQEKP